MITKLRFNFVKRPSQILQLISSSVSRVQIGNQAGKCLYEQSRVVLAHMRNTAGSASSTFAMCAHPSQQRALRCGQSLRFDRAPAAGPNTLSTGPMHAELWHSTASVCYAAAAFCLSRLPSIDRDKCRSYRCKSNPLFYFMTI